MTNVKAIEVPMDAKDCFVSENGKLKTWCSAYVLYKPLPPGNWQFLFLTRDMKSDQVDGVVPSKILLEYGGHGPDRIKLYYDFRTHQFHFEYPEESFHSWLRSQGLEESKNYAILIDNDKK